MWSGERGDDNGASLGGLNFPVGIQEVEEFEQCLQTPPAPPEALSRPTLLPGAVVYSWALPEN